MILFLWNVKLFKLFVNFRFMWQETKRNNRRHQSSSSYRFVVFVVDQKFLSLTKRKEKLQILFFSRFLLWLLWLLLFFRFNADHDEVLWFSRRSKVVLDDNKFPRDFFHGTRLKRLVTRDLFGRIKTRMLF